MYDSEEGERDDKESEVWRTSAEGCALLLLYSEEEEDYDGGIAAGRQACAA